MKVSYSQIKDIKYERKIRANIPGVELKQGHEGVIVRVDCYPDHDHFRGKGTNSRYESLLYLPIDLSRRILLGMGIGNPIPGTVEECLEEQLIEMIKGVPLDKMVLDTDCPFTIQPSNPEHVKLIAEAVAEIKGVSIEEVAKATTENARKIFKI